VSTLKGAPQQTAVPPQPVKPVRLLPVPSSILVPGSRPPRAPRWLAWAGVLAASFAVGLLGALMWPLPPSKVVPVPAPSGGAIVKGDPVSSSVCAQSPAPQPEQKQRLGRRAMLAVAACTALACAGVKVRTGDLDWLAQCPAEARETVRLLGINPGAPDDEGPAVAILLKGPSVIPHHIGCEVRDGPVEASVLMDPMDASGTLKGTIRVGSDGASFRFHELVRGERRYPICAIGAEDFVNWGPGVDPVYPDSKSRAPASELHPKEYIYITTGRLRIRVAPYLPEQSKGRVGVN